MLKLLALVLPLSLDTFAVSAALGSRRLSRHQRLRLSLILASFEAVMPLIGVAVGHALGPVTGSLGDYIAGGALLAFGTFLLVTDDEDEDELAARLTRAQGLAMIGIGIGISLDELAVGFSIGLLHLSLGWAIALIAIQAFAAAQLGIRLGARLGEAARGRIEHVAALALIAVGLAVLTAHAAR